MDLEPGGVPEITDADVAASSGRVRWLQVQRLEGIWRVIEGHLNRDPDLDSGDRPVDPRMVELGLRTVKQMSELYRLARPAVEAPEEPDVEQVVIDRRALIEQELAAIEERMRAEKPKE